ncbi:CsbD-like protein [Streptococcus porcinus]|uniref:CsbD family protein n=1 Tax=Streptococcus porcinus TaxID=1340 RepID=UPI0010CAC429|nr:CsbD family protein [Streptococcus porcinus]VTS25311.1 CsbD-like protein [Streptococcus porcinus]
MSDEKLKAKMEQVTGSVKESLGKLSGDKSLETEGKVNKTTGKVDEVTADTKDALDGLAKGLKDKTKE